MCALDSLLPPFPTNPLSQHRNALCAHGCVFVFAQHGVCFCATRGRARDLLRSWHSGPKTIADLMAAIVPRPCAVCTTPSQWTQLSFGFHVFHWCASRTSWCLQAGAPEASWPRSAFPASYHRGEHKSRTPVTRFVDVRSEPPSHDGVSNLGYPRLLSWTGCRTSWSGTPFPKGAVEVVESVAS